METQNKRKLNNFSWSTMICFTWIASLLAVMLTFVGSTPAYAANSYDFKVTSATTDFYVNDFAGLFTDQQKADMMEKAVSLDKEYGGIQVVVTTVNSLADCADDGKSHDIYDTSYAMYNQYGIGEDSMGILILFSVGDRDVYMQTGYKMQTYITDSKSGQLLDNYGMDYFVEDQFAEGLVSLQEGTISEIKSVVPQDWNAPAVASEPDKKEENAVVAGASNVTKTNSDSSKKSNGGLYGILAAFIAMIVGLIASIKSLFTSKSKAMAQKEESDKKLREQKESYERQIAEIRKNAENSSMQAVVSNNETWKRNLDQKERAFKEEVSGLERQIVNQSKTIKDLEVDIAELNRKLNASNATVEKYKDKVARIKALHPGTDFEAEIAEMIENEFKESAQKVDAKIAPCADIPANKDNVGIFDEAIRIYQSQNSDVQKYITTDIQKLRGSYEQSVLMKQEYERAEKEKRDRATAKSAYAQITAICSGINHGTHENYDSLNKAYRIYTNLSSAERGYFPNQDLIRNLESLRREADTDRKNFEAAHDAEKEVRRIVDRIYSADEGDRDTLERALRYYKNLSTAQQVYFSQELARKTKHMLDEAEEDHRRKEAERRRRKEEEERRRREEEERRRRRQREEEERRRRSMMSSSSSFSSHSSFGGHGGHASGGGAGRHF